MWRWQWITLICKDDSDYLAFKETTWSYRSTFFCKPVPPLSQPIQICCWRWQICKRNYDMYIFIESWNQGPHIFWTKFRNFGHCVRRHSFEKKLRITVNHERSGLEMMFTVFWSQVFWCTRSKEIDFVILSFFDYRKTILFWIWKL